MTSTNTTLTLAIFTTTNHEFIAAGTDETTARQALTAAWATHVAQTGADEDYLTEFGEDVRIVTLTAGSALRDFEAIATA